MSADIRASTTTTSSPAPPQDRPGAVGEYVEYPPVETTAAGAGSHERAGAVAFVARFARRHIQGLVFVVVLLVLVGMWQLAASQGWVNPLILSSPSAVFDALINYLGSPQAAIDLRTSGIELAAGFGIVVAAGVTIGLLAGTSRVVDIVVSPLVNMLNSVPRIALIPIFIIIFGIGVESKIATIVAVALIPVIISAQAGVRSVPAELLTVAVVFDANALQRFTKVLLPGAIPAIIGGLRIGLGQALVGVIVGEFFAASAGIGFFMIKSANQLQTANVLAGTVIVTVIGWSLATAMTVAERYFHRRHGGI
ncbi:ABC transporter permease [Actinophytocola sp.]|uniref:ABC transporter permease n=1 Tax=Actinophytocola sp. TaxID=1872138 RepID=UPI003D6A5C62